MCMHIVHEVQLDDTIACWQKQYEIKWNWKQQLKHRHTNASNDIVEKNGKKNTKIPWNKSNNVEKQTYMVCVCVF